MLTARRRATRSIRTPTRIAPLGFRTRARSGADRAGRVVVFARQGLARPDPFALLVLSALLASVAACHNSPCHNPGFEEGERFQVTVLGANTAACPFAPLAPSDSFVLTGGRALQDASQCTVRGATPEVPAFAAGVLTSCRESLTSLGLECTGVVYPSCPVSAQLRLAPRIERDVVTIEDGLFWIVWSTNGCNGGGCRDDYDVRIHRMDPLPAGE